MPQQLLELPSGEDGVLEILEALNDPLNRVEEAAWREMLYSRFSTIVISAFLSNLEAALEE